MEMCLSSHSTWARTFISHLARLSGFLFFDSWDHTVAYPMTGANFQASDHVGRATLLRHNQRPLPPGRVSSTSTSAGGFPALLSLRGIMCKVQSVGISRQPPKALHCVTEAERGCWCCVYTRDIGVGIGKHVWDLLSVLGTLWVLWLCDSIMML